MKIVKLYLTVFVLFIGSKELKAQNITNKSNIIKMENFNQLDSLHVNTKSLSVKILFEGKEGVTRSLQINKDGILAEHITKTEAILICVSGKVIYEDEKSTKHTLKSGDFYKIEPNVKHWVKGVENSQLLLIK
jgi:quercetin dioxygenase-like cupin family protein